MTYLTSQPQALAAVATDVEGIGSAISAANSAAAVRTSSLLAPAADEVSAAITDLFGQYGQDYRALLAQAEAFHSQFAQTLAAAGGAYAAAEAAAQRSLGTLGTDAQALLGAGAAPNPFPAADVAVVMGGSGNPIPNLTFVNGVLKWAQLSGFSWQSAQAIFTPENLYPLTGVKSLTLDISVNEGVQILDATIKQYLAGNSTVLVQGYSQSSIIASLEMRNLLNSPNPPLGSQLAFNLLGDPMNPNGGLLARFPGLSLPSLGLDFYGATPANTPWQTSIYSLEYDGFADFPQYPINLLADLNAVAGIVYVHPLYPHLNPSTLPPGDIVKLPVDPTYTGPMANTTYYMVHTQNLPLLEPLRAIPVLGNPLADLLQPDMRALVNLGYGDPNYGYSTGPANVPTSFGLFPPINPGVLGADLVSGAQQGVSAAGMDLAAEGLTSPSMISQPLSMISMPPLNLLASPPSVGGIVQSLETTGINVVDAYSSAASTAYSALLPTADIVNAAVTAIPAYDASLFVNGIAQAAGGDPMGLINAVGDPVAASIGLLTVSGGVEGLVLLTTGVTIAKDFAPLIP